VQRQARLTKRERRELDRPTNVRLQRPRTLTRMTTPPLPVGWMKCPACGMALEVAALFVLQMIEPPKTSNDNGDVIENPDVGKVAISGHMCPGCVQPIWPE
jgi:hypothetical protein